MLKVLPRLAIAAIVFTMAIKVAHQTYTNPTPAALMIESMRSQGEMHRTY